MMDDTPWELDFGTPAGGNNIGELPMGIDVSITRVSPQSPDD